MEQLDSKMIDLNQKKDKMMAIAQSTEIRAASIEKKVKVHRQVLGSLTVTSAVHDRKIQQLT